MFWAFFHVFRFHVTQLFNSSHEKNWNIWPFLGHKLFRLSIMLMSHVSRLANQRSHIYLKHFQKKLWPIGSEPMPAGAMLYAGRGFDRWECPSGLDAMPRTRYFNRQFNINQRFTSLTIFFNIWISKLSFFVWCKSNIYNDIVIIIVFSCYQIVKSLAHIYSYYSVEK